MSSRPWAHSLVWLPGVGTVSGLVKGLGPGSQGQHADASLAGLCVQGPLTTPCCEPGFLHVTLVTIPAIWSSVTGGPKPAAIYFTHKSAVWAGLSRDGLPLLHAAPLKWGQRGDIQGAQSVACRLLELLFLAGCRPPRTTPPLHGAA